MKCRVCNVDKLSKEFPRENITDTCDHPPIHCLRCVIEHVNEARPVCPYNGCGAEIIDPGRVVDECRMDLDQLYPPVQASTEVEELQRCDASSSDERINITMLTGDSVSLAFNPAMSVERLKTEIKKSFGVEEDKQQLVYNDRVLEDYVDGIVRRLSDYDIKPFHTFHLMVLLYAIPSHFDHVIFDLFWGYPTHGRDYLDASCLVFNGKALEGVVDYAHRTFSDSIWHSGDVMDDVNRKGHHTIEVRLKQLRSSVTHLFFTLSAWNSPTIAHYPSPSLKFFEASNKSKDLCSTTFTHARHSQAVVMCYVARSAGQWKIFSCGTLSAGNAKNYKPLVSTIQSLINS